VKKPREERKLHRLVVRRKWYVRFLVGLALVALVAAGCGGDGDDDSSSSDTSSETGSTTSVVKIGVIAPLDAGLTSFGKGIENSVQLAVDQANERDAIPGFEIEVAAEDDSSDPAIGKQAAEKLADDDAVIGVVGTYNSGVAAEVAPVLEQAGIVEISPGNTDPALTLGPDANAPVRQHDNYFRVVANDAQQGSVLANYAYGDLGATTVAVVSETKPVSKGLADRFSADFAAKGGQVVYTKTVPDGTTDFADVVAEISPLDANLIFFGGEYEVAAALRTAAAGIDAPLMGGDGIKDDAYIEAAGADAEGDIASSIGAPLADLESAAQYAEDYEAAGYSDPPSVFGPYAYDAANVIIEAAASALEGASKVTPEAREAVLESVQATETDGITGTIAFDAYGDTVTKVFTIYTVTNGKWEPVVTVEAT
jgi:branched-chain amino acid transport system substrate-binding protein